MRSIAFIAAAGLLGIAAARATARQTVDYAPWFTPGDVVAFAEELSLSDEQQVAVSARFESYGDAFRASTAVVRERVSGLRTALDGPNDNWEEAIHRTQSARGRVLAAWEDDRATLREGFVADVRALLTEEQTERWPVLDRRLRREKTLGRGRIAGESLDLFLAVRVLGPPPLRPELAALLDAYAIDLDDVLRARNALPIQFADGYSPAREVAARQAVRDVNLEYADLIVAGLTPARADALRDAVNTSAFARVCRRTGVQTRLRNAATRAEIDEAQRAVVVDLEAEYLARLAAWRERQRETIRRHEPAAFLRRLERSNRPLEEPAGAPADDPIQAGFLEGRALDTEVMTRLRALLTPAQADALLGKEGKPAGTAGNRRRTSIEQQAWVMDQFDANGDGRLDDVELEALREYLRTSRDR